MNTVTISWNVTNWITIFLMALAGYAVLGLASQLYKNYSPAGKVAA